MKDYYLDGACESGSRDDCGNLSSGKTSHRIHCCPNSRNTDFGNPQNCTWSGKKSGKRVTCPEGQIAFGRCSTSGRRGECQGDSHKALCCNTNTELKSGEECGWLNADYGVNLRCPEDLYP